MHLMIHFIIELTKFIWKQFRFGGILLIILFVECIGIYNGMQDDVRSQYYNGDLSIQECRIIEEGNICKLLVTISNEGSYTEQMPDIKLVYGDNTKWLDSYVYGQYASDGEYEKTVIPGGQQAQITYQIPRYDQNRDAIKKSTDTYIKLLNAGLGKDTEFPVSFQ